MKKVINITASKCSECRFHGPTGMCSLMEKPTDFGSECQLDDAARISKNEDGSTYIEYTTPIYVIKPANGRTGGQ